MTELEIDIRNQEQQLSLLRTECAEVSKELTEVYNSKKEELLALEAKKVEILERLHEEEVRAKGRADSLQKERDTFDSQKNARKEILSKLDGEIRERTKHLGWVNEKIFNGENYISELEEKQRKVEKFIEEHSKLSEMVETLRSEIPDLIDQKNAILTLISDESIRSESSLLKQKQETEELIRLGEEAVRKAEKAKIEFENFVRDSAIRETDWLIMKERLEKRFHEHYPELELKI